MSGAYTVPDDDNAWFVQGKLDFADSTDYDVSYFSIKRTKTSDTTDDFRMLLSGKPYAVSGRLGRFQTREFAVDPIELADRDGVITFAPSIKGNHYGMARLIYHAPLLMGRNARYKVNGVKGNTFDITLTAGLSGYSRTFEMFPFSRKYGGLSVRADDGSAKSDTSKNLNQWITCPAGVGTRIQVTYPTKLPQQ